MKRLGYLVDPHDPRDRLLGTRLRLSTTPLPSQASVLADGYNVWLEQHAQSCVGFAVAIALYAAWRYQGFDAAEPASASFIWYNSRATHGAQAANSPTYIRSAFKQLAKLGYCRERDWPSLHGLDALKCGVRPPLSAYRNAHDQHLDAVEYVRLDAVGIERIAQWKAMLSTGKPIVFGIPITEDYLTLREHEAYGGSRGVVIGGHAQCALGYDERGPYGPGSWDADWGNRGWWHLSWEWLARNVMDAWALIAPPYYSA